MKFRAVSCAAAGAAAVCSLFSLHASGQLAAIERAQSTGVQAGLERALRTPLEIIWLRTAAEIDMWRHPALAQAAQNCLKPGDTKQGCAIVGRSAWRYVFGGNVPFGGAPNEVARLLVSSLNLPEATLSAGRLNLAGSGRLYVLTPDTPDGVPPTRGVVVLAAGSVLQLVDAASPYIQVELRAREDQPLLLGNLAAADVGKMLALLVKPGTASASEASMNERGRVALRSSGEIQLASILTLPANLPPDLGQTAVAMQSNPERIDAAPSGLAFELPSAFTQIAFGLETPTASVSGEQIVLASLAPLAGMAAGEILANASALRIAPTIDLAQDFTQIALGLETPTASVSGEQIVLASLAPLAAGESAELLANAKAFRAEPTLGLAPELLQIAGRLEIPAPGATGEQILLASLAPLAGTEGAEMLVNSKALRVEDVLELAQDLTQFAFGLETPTASVSGEQIVLASLTPLAGIEGAEMLVNAKALRVEGALDLAQDFTQIALGLETPAQAARPVMIIIASAPQTVASLPAVGATADIARMRAEIEAEIARDRERLAQARTVGAAGSKRFLLGV